MRRRRRWQAGRAGAGAGQGRSRRLEAHHPIDRAWSLDAEPCCPSARDCVHPPVLLSIPSVPPLSLSLLASPVQAGCRASWLMQPRECGCASLCFLPLPYRRKNPFSCGAPAVPSAAPSGFGLCFVVVAPRTGQSLSQTIYLFDCHYLRAATRALQRRQGAQRRQRHGCYQQPRCSCRA